MNMKAIQKICYGVYIISSKMDGKINGQIANTAFQITSDPPTMAISINKQNLSHDYIMSSRVFSVSILSKEAPMTLIGQFGFKSGRDIDKFAGVSYVTDLTGAPMIKDWTVAAFEAKIHDMMEMPTHMIFVGEVVSAQYFKDAPLLTYADYHTIKKGKSPKTAPTFGFNSIK